MWCASSVGVDHKQRTVHGLCMRTGVGCGSHVRAMTDGRSTEKNTDRDCVPLRGQHRRVGAPRHDVTIMIVQMVFIFLELRMNV